jgi:hypothetical protein
MKKNDFGFNVGFSENSFETDYPYCNNKINIKFYYGNDATVCKIEDPQACQIYAQFASLKVFSIKKFNCTIDKDNIIFTGKAVPLSEDSYNKKEGEEIALEKALAKRQAFYILLMDLVKVRLWNIQNESWKTIKQKHKNMWDKKCPEDKQLELPFNKKGK